jgi:uncharacterized protein
MERANCEWAIAVILSRLREGLSPRLTFHSLWHTQEDVLPAVRRLARLHGLADEQSRLIEVAAAYHDSGFLETFEEHEQVSARIAAGTLPGCGFTPGEVEQVTRLILATRLPQRPCGLLEEILADADLDVLGRDDFMERSEALRQEYENLGRPVSRRSWLQEQLGFLERHRYFTLPARELREAGKQKHIELLRHLLDGGE